MKISNEMNLNELLLRMDLFATVDHAATMRDMLVGKFDGQDTGNVMTDADWNYMVDVSMGKRV